MEWDTAAGDAVLRAAGGAVVTLDGAPLRYGKTGVPGMREFENPYFLAAGDRDAAASGSTLDRARARMTRHARLPLVLETRGWTIMRCSIPATGESSSASAR